MGAKTYVAGLKAETANSITNTAMQGLGVAKRLKEAKDTADINREKLAIEGKANEFLSGLEQDRDWQKYPEKLDEAFADITAGIDDNELLSSAAKKQLKEEILPLYKESASQSVTSLQSKSQLAEVQVEVDGYGSVLTNNTGLSVQDASAKYREHLTDLGLWNEYTVDKKVEEYEYGMAPAKAVQSLMKAYQETYTEGDASFQQKANEIIQEYDLDPAQSDQFFKTATAQKKVFDDKVDDMYSDELDNLRLQISEAYATGNRFSTESIDAMIEQAPDRWKTKLRKEKNTVFTNNDVVSENYIDRLIVKGNYIGDEDIAIAESIMNPDKRSKMMSKILQNNINATPTTTTPAPKKKVETVDYELPAGTDGTKQAQSTDYTEQEAEDPVEDIKSPVPPVEEVEELTIEQQMDAVNNTDLPVSEREKIRTKAWILSDNLTAKMSFEEINRALIAAFPENPVEDEPQIAEPSSEEPVTVEDPVEQTEEVTVEDPVVENQEAATVQEEENPVEESADPVSTGADFTEDVDSTAGATRVERDPTKDPGYRTPRTDTAGMSGSQLASTMIINAKLGYDYKRDEYNRLPPEYQTLIDDMIISGKDVSVVNDVVALKALQTARMDPNVSGDNYSSLLQDMVVSGVITQETAEKMSRPSYINNPNFKYVDEFINQFMDTYEDDIGDSLDFRYDLTEAMNRLITQNPSLIDNEGFGNLRNIMAAEAENIMAGGVLTRLTNLLDDVTKNGSVKLENLRSKDMKSVKDKDFQFYMADVKNGEYNLYIRKDFITNPDLDMNMKSFRKSSKENILNQVSETVKGVSYDDLQKTGSRLDLLEVTATADFISAGGMLEKALYGSFGVKAGDMIMIDGQWAFSDPELEGSYFIPEFTDSVSKDGISWTMAYVKNNKVVKRVPIGDYVDPSLKFEHKEQQEYMNSRAYRVKEEKQESTPLAARARNYGTVNHDFTQADREKMTELDSKLRQAEQDVVSARFNLYR